MFYVSLVFSNIMHVQLNYCTVFGNHPSLVSQPRIKYYLGLTHLGSETSIYITSIEILKIMGIEKSSFFYRFCVMTV